VNLRNTKNSNSCDETVQILERAHGLDISFYEESFLRKVIDKRRVEVGIRTTAEYNVVLAENRSEAEKLCDSLRIIYSEFFRNPLSFALLEQLILPGLIKAKRKSGGTGRHSYLVSRLRIRPGTLVGCHLA
jgi:chemotaxis methyl-accepting protein methylase